MESEQRAPQPRRAGRSSGRDITLKALLLFGMLLLLQIPVWMIQRLIEGREERSSVVDGVQDTWGGEATISQPYVNFRSGDSTQVRIGETSSNMEVEIVPQELSRGIYSTVVYTAQVKHTLLFAGALEASAGRLELVVPGGLFKLKGEVKATLNGKPLAAAGLDNEYTHAALFKLPGKGLAQGDSIEVQFSLLGSNSLSFTKIQEKSQLTVTSTWPSPSFMGDHLPLTREIDKHGFKAVWDLSATSQGGDSLSAFGVRLLNPVDHYRLTDRATKYALLFIALTFLAFFLTETVNRWRIHPIQYFLVGVAMVVFYSLLLSFSEHLGFGWAYLISSLSTITLLSLYSLTVLQRNRISTAIITSLLVVLYLFLYFILQMEDFALLAGSVLLFFSVAIAMYALRNIKWYEQA